MKTKKQIFSILVTSALLMFSSVTQLSAQELPKFDEPNSFVVDSEVKSGDRFNVAVRVVDYAINRTITAEVYGYGGKFHEEWDLIGTVNLRGWGDKPMVPFVQGAKIDYIHYRYFAIKIINPTPEVKKYKFTSAQKERCLDFYVWEENANTKKDPLPYYIADPSVRVYDAVGRGCTNYSDDLYVACNSEYFPLYVTVYAYNQKKFTWTECGSAQLDSKGDVKKIKGKYNLKDYRYFAVKELNTGRKFSLNFSTRLPKFSTSVSFGTGGLGLTHSTTDKDLVITFSDPDEDD